MADLEKIVKLIFEGDGKGLTSEMNRMSRDFDSFSKGVQGATKPLADFGIAALKVEAGLLLIGGAAMSAAIIKASEFQTTMGEIQTLSSEGDLSGFGDLGAALLAFAQDSTAPLEDIAAAFYDANSAGYSLVDSFEILKDSEALSVVGKSSLSSAFNLISSAAQNFGDEAGTSTEIANLLFKAVEQGKTKIELLEVPLSKLGPLAAGAGIGLDEMLAVVSDLTKSGMPTSEAVSAIKAAISNIIKPTADATTTAKALNIEFNATALSKNGIISLFNEISKKAGGNTQLMSDLFGSVEGLNAALYLTSTNGIADLNKIFTRMNDGADVVAEKFKLMKDEVGKQLETLINNFDTVLIKAGLPLLDKFGDGVGSLSGVFKGISFAMDDGAFDDISEFINSGFANISENLKTIAGNLPEALNGVDFSGLTDALGRLSGTIGEGISDLFGGDIDLSTVEGLQDAVQGAIDLAENLTRFVDKFIETGINPLLKGIGLLGDSAKGDGASDAIDFLGEISGYSNLLNITFGALDGVKTALLAMAGIGGFTTILTFLSGLTSASMVGILGAGGIAGGGLLAVLAVIHAIRNETEQPIEVALQLRDESFAENVKEGITDPLDRMKRKVGEFSDETSTRLKLLFSGDFAGLIDRNNNFKVTGERINKDINTGLNKDPITLDADSALGVMLKLQNAGDDVAASFFDVSEEAHGISESIDDISYLKIDTEPAKQSLSDLLENPVFNDILDIEIQATTDGTAIYSWVDDAGNVHFSDKPGDGAFTDLPEVGILAVVGLDEETAKDSVDKTKTYIEEMKISAETVQTAMEWSAKLDIAEAEANAKILESAFASIGTTISASADVLGDMFGKFGGDLSYLEKSNLRDWIEDELELKRQAFELQKKLTEEQIKMSEARRKAMEDGDALMNISIDDSVTPAIKLILFEVLNLMQVEMNEMADQYLLGVPA